MPNSEKTYLDDGKHARSDRCANPFNSHGYKSTTLRKISKTIHGMFPHLPKNARICASCRKSCKLSNESGFEDSTSTENSYPADDTLNDAACSRDSTLSAESVGSLEDSNVELASPPQRYNAYLENKN